MTEAPASLASPTAESLSQQQLLIFARDLKKALRQERERAAELSFALEQMNLLNQRLEQSLEAERISRTETEQAHRDSILRLLLASRFKDEETGAHIARVGHYSLLLARAIGLGEERAQLIAAAAPMHDVGKIAVKDSILSKRGSLNAEERIHMQAHTTRGAELLSGSQSPLIHEACTIALTHHERWDGTGYPRGLRGEEIPVSGRIVMLADQYDALRSVRSYKPGLTHQRTCQIILEGDGRTIPQHFDPRLLAAFRRLEREFETLYAIETTPDVLVHPWSR